MQYTWEGSGHGSPTTHLYSFLLFLYLHQFCHSASPKQKMVRASLTGSGLVQSFPRLSKDCTSPKSQKAAWPLASALMFKQQ